MNELHFTLKLALKLFAGLILLGVWLMARQQAKLDKRNSEARAEARKQGLPEPPREIIPRSTLVIAGAALLFLIVALFWGNESAL